MKRRTWLTIAIAGPLLTLVHRAWAEPPDDVLEFFRSAADSLANDDAKAFLDHFDPAMLRYEQLRDEIEALLAADEVGSTIEIVSDKGDGRTRSLDLDWLLLTNERDAVNGPKSTKRAVIHCKIERKGKQWKIQAIEPIDFFKP